MLDLTLAIDIGGTKIAVGLVNPVGALVHTIVLPTPAGDAETVWAVLQRLIAETTADTAVRGVGISSAGPIDLLAGAISPLNIPGWRDFPVCDRVAAMLPGVPVRLGGDGLCMALGEYRHGAGRAAQSLLGMVVSTGIGGGLILDGVPYDGLTGNAGHVGHVVVDFGGELCACGARGCVEAIASGPRMVRWAREHGWDAPVAASAKELAATAKAGNDVALKAFHRGASAVAAMIASVGAVCDLDLVVIGGGVAKAGALLFDPVRQQLGTYAGLSFLRGLRVVPAELGSNAGLVGAAALVNT
jgi:glucokinase